ncbi:MAG: thymidine phosphorylase, partial [Pseudomonadota bacterium]
AACGGYVPMISGRGLGHTGGTLDKFDSIPGYQTQPDTDTLRTVTRAVGCAIIGATADIAPADKRLYAIRDISGTVESIDLITASILSKKLAAGLDALILDVKVGTGAFMAKMEDAKALAESLVSVGNGAGMRTAALLTDMNQVLGRTAGNAVEVAESIAMLKGEETDPRLTEVTIALCGQVLALVGLAADPAEGREKSTQALSSGQAAEKFGQMVTALGGPADLMEAPGRHLIAAPVIRPVYADKTGHARAIDTRALGIAIVTLGGGRTDPTASIDHRVGLTDVAGLGERVGPGEAPLALLHAADESGAALAEAAVKAAFEIGEKASTPPVIAGDVAPPQ